MPRRRTRRKVSGDSAPRTGTNDGHIDAHVQRSYYIDQICLGVERYREDHWRCEERDPSGTRRCHNRTKTHDKGHQFTPRSRNSGFEVRAGLYKSSWEPVKFKEALWGELGNESEWSVYGPTRSLAARTKALGLRALPSQMTCLACLDNCPTNVLPCQQNQHSFCESCMRQFSVSSRSESIIALHHCPLGCSLTSVPWIIRVKPARAQPRILVLDG